MASTLPTLVIPSVLPSQMAVAEWSSFSALQSMDSESHYFISGEVQVEAGASIGAGVLLRANPGCCIQIRRGVCIGMGSILHACGGSLIIEAGATLGMGVLVIGQGTIGSQACIGSETTLLNCSILRQQVIPPRSLIGDPSYIGVSREPEAVPSESDQATPPPPPSSPVENVEKQVEKQAPHQEEATQFSQDKPRPLKIAKLNGIPGQAELNQLLGKIYPHRQALFSNDG